METPFLVENPYSCATPIVTWLPSHTPAGLSRPAGAGHVDCWNKLQSQVPSTALPYIHPFVQRSKDLVSQTNLEMCTEILGSETGSDELDHQLFSISSPYVDEDKICQQEVFSEEIDGRREMVPSMNYHCTGRRSPTRSFPPPLPSISRRDGQCFQLRPHRCEGRLIIETVAIPSQNYLHAHRHEGRLVLTSSYQICSTALASNKPHDQPQYTNRETKDKNDEDENSKKVEEVGDDKDEEEVVEVVDRGMVVEVKVSTQQQQQRKMLPKTTTAAAAALAASSVTALSVVTEHSFPLSENLLVFTTKSRNQEETLFNIQRCSELQRPLFIWEPCCVAAS